MLKRLSFVYAVIFLSGCVSAAKNNSRSELKNCSKSVTVVAEWDAEMSLMLRQISFKKVLDAANKIFSSNNLDFKYDSENLRLKSVRELKTIKQTKLAYNNLSFSDRRSDIIIFLSFDAAALEGSDGWAFNRKYTLDFLNINLPPKVMGIVLLSTKSCNGRNNTDCLKGLSKLVVHEQSHLYDVRHVEDKQSIMHWAVGDSDGKFDRISLGILEKALRGDKKCSVP